MRTSLFLSLVMATFLTLPACALLETRPLTPTAPSHPKLTATNFSNIPDWTAETMDSAISAFTKSCSRIQKGDPQKDFGWLGLTRDWQEVCRHIPPETASAHEVRNFFETWFTPYHVTESSGKEGLFTGYYEAALHGSRTRTGPYQTPLLSRPSDLVMVNLGEFRPELKGQRIAGRVISGQLKPFEDRAAIETGRLSPKTVKVLCWVDSPVDAFFLQVQGSGIVQLTDGTSLRVGYDGQNGHIYTAIGKELIARGELTKENVSMQTLRDWMAKHPNEATELMRQNKSYVFFKVLDSDGSIGGEGTVLTPQRSLAVDHSIWPYGVPMFIATEHPSQKQPLNRLFFAQDTGGAIIGSVRGDVFWGYGDDATHNAGLMKSPGQMWILLPKTLAPDSLVFSK